MNDFRASTAAVESDMSFKGTSGLVDKETGDH
jgi:hypothetical protein